MTVKVELAGGRQSGDNSGVYMLRNLEPSKRSADAKASVDFAQALANLNTTEIRRFLASRPVLASSRGTNDSRALVVVSSRFHE